MQGVAEGPRFSEAETALVLAKTPWDSLPEETRGKLRSIAWEYHYPLLPRNLRPLLQRKTAGAWQEILTRRTSVNKDQANRDTAG